MWIKSAYTLNIISALCKGSVIDFVSSTGSLDSRCSCHWKVYVPPSVQVAVSGYSKNTSKIKLYFQTFRQSKYGDIPYFSSVNRCYVKTSMHLSVSHYFATMSVAFELNHSY